jgi:hypothetical protein
LEIFAMGMLALGWLVLLLARLGAYDLHQAGDQLRALARPSASLAPLRSPARGVGNELFDARPEVWPDASAKLGSRLPEHRRDRVGVESGDPRFLDDGDEVDSGLPDHPPEMPGPVVSLTER